MIQLPINSSDLSVNGNRLEKTSTQELITCVQITNNHYQQLCILSVLATFHLSLIAITQKSKKNIIKRLQNNYIIIVLHFLTSFLLNDVIWDRFILNYYNTNFVQRNCSWVKKAFFQGFLSKNLNWLTSQISYFSHEIYVFHKNLSQMKQSLLYAFVIRERKIWRY